MENTKTKIAELQNSTWIVGLIPGWVARARSATPRMRALFRGRSLAISGAAVATLASTNYVREVRFRDDPSGLGEEARCHRLSSSPPPRLTAAQLASLSAEGFVVLPRFLTPAHVRAARAEAAAMHADGDFGTPIGGGSVRTDAVHWLGTGATRPALVAALAELRAIAEPLRRFRGFDAARRDDGLVPGTSPLGVPRTAQLAWYAPEGGGAAGGRYGPHRDAPPHPRALVLPGIYMREVTAVLYLSPNEDEWVEDGCDAGGREGRAHSASALSTSSPCTEASSAGGGGDGGGGDRRGDCTGDCGGGGGSDGGEALRKARGRPGSLMLYVGAAACDTSGVSARRLVEVRPAGGTLVLFDARRMLHEVVPHGGCAAERVALTVWMGGAHRGSSWSEVGLAGVRTVVGNVCEWAMIHAPWS
jgi:hypothetical protein